MREIPLTNGGMSLVDDDIWIYASAMSWRKFTNKSGNTYAATWKFNGKLTYFLHWLVVGIPVRPEVVDHIDNDGLNNQRSNLRIVSQSINVVRSKLKTSIPHSGGHRGVYLIERNPRKPWKAQVGGQHLGYFAAREAAIIAADKYGRAEYGEHWRCECLS